MIEIVGVLVAAGDGEYARAQDVGDAMSDEGRVSRSAISGPSLAAVPREVSMAASNITPPRTSGVPRQMRR